MRRVEDWQKQLAVYLADAKRKVFAWYENDCVMFGARWVEVATGRNFYAPYGVYSTEEEAAAIIQAHGGLVKMISSALGPGHRNPLKAMRGDLVLVKSPERMIGIVADDGVSIALVTREGQTRYPLGLAWRIWSV